MGTFMTKHCSSALRHGSPIRQEDPKQEKNKPPTEAEYVDRELNKLMGKNKKPMTAQEVLEATQNIKQVYKQLNLGK